jgi:hypothetical protein
MGMVTPVCATWRVLPPLAQQALCRVHVGMKSPREWVQLIRLLPFALFTTELTQPVVTFPPSPARSPPRVYQSTLDSHYTTLNQRSVPSDAKVRVCPLPHSICLSILQSSETWTFGIERLCTVHKGVAWHQPITLPTPPSSLRDVTACTPLGKGSSGAATLPCTHRHDHPTVCSIARVAPPQHMTSRLYYYYSCT